MGDIVDDVANTADDVASSSNGFKAAGDLTDDAFKPMGDIVDDVANTADDVVNSVDDDWDDLVEIVDDGPVQTFEAEIIDKYGNIASEESLAVAPKNGVSVVDVFGTVDDGWDDLVEITDDVVNKTNGNLINKGLMFGDGVMQFDNQNAKEQYRLDNIEGMETEIAQLDTGEFTAVPISDSSNSLVEDVCVDDSGNIPVLPSEDGLTNNETLDNSSMNNDVNIPPTSSVPSYTGSSSNNNYSGGGNFENNVSNEVVNNDAVVPEEIINSSNESVSSDYTPVYKPEVNDSIISSTDNNITDDMNDVEVESEVGEDINSIIDTEVDDAQTPAFVDKNVVDSKADNDGSNVLKTVLGVGGVVAAGTAIGIGAKKYIDKSKENNSIEDEFLEEDDL